MRKRCKPCACPGTRFAPAAAAFADDWKDAAYEKGETQSFYNAFVDA